MLSINRIFMSTQKKLIKTENKTNEKNEVEYWDSSLWNESPNQVKAPENRSIKALIEEAEKETIKLSMKEMQARVAQEQGLAEAIQSATEVEIEECYEELPESNSDLKSNEESCNRSVSGTNGKKVTKRIYRFKT
jgi:hypothetical protein